MSEKLRTALEQLGRSGQVAFAAGCAQAISPVIERLGSTETVAAARLACELMWSAARGLDVDVADQAEALLELPEADIDDSHQPAYLCMSALGVVSDAIESVRSESPLESAMFASEGVWGLLGGVDLVLELGMDAARVADPSNPPAPGPLACAELQAQLDSARLLTGADHAAAVNAVEQLAHRRAQAVRDVLPDYLQRHFSRPGPGSR